jgi:glycosyltransferase involved in cell wall biosynthesis
VGDLKPEKRVARIGSNPLRILILSWRDPQNPKAGGAELFTYEVARRLVAGGDTVEWFTAMFPGAAAKIELDGVQIVRGGRQWSVHVAAMRRYRGHLRDSFDAVIDEVNTIPFFTPLWADVPHLLLIFQLAREVWWHETGFPLNAVGYAAEPLYLRPYRRTVALTISASTEADLRRLGFTGAIKVLPIGLEPIAVPSVPKEDKTTFLYVGRMAPSKRVDDIIQAFAHYRAKGRDGMLWLVGDGPSTYFLALHELVGQLGLAEKVQFLGRVSPEVKHDRMARAHVLLMASVREGWGLSIAEANACGTPAVVYDVPGLRDAVRNGETGFVVPPTPWSLADGMERITANPALYEPLARAARLWSSTFSFDAAAHDVRQAIVSAIEVTG